GAAALLLIGSAERLSGLDLPQPDPVPVGNPPPPPVPSPPTSGPLAQVHSAEITIYLRTKSPFFGDKISLQGASFMGSQGNAANQFWAFKDKTGKLLLVNVADVLAVQVVPQVKGEIGKK